ncbi:MAG: methyltransferase domain-containing protein [Deltaproteobacteria bacterium]|nr:methyltransferase domain-containing protein [Deltaproteobacteria bacterium]
MIDVLHHNKRAWNAEVEKGNEWTRPVTPEVIAAARAGEWSIVLTPTKAVPRDWFPGTLEGCELLGLASGGGQQCPVLAAAGARVTVIDNSPAQLQRDREVAKREGLSIRCEEGDMADLSRFADESFDLIVHPISNCFVPDVLPVWREAFRVLKPGGALLAGFNNPVIYLFDLEAYERGELIVRHRLPYSDLDLPPEEQRRFTEGAEPLEFGHTLEDQLGGQLAAGFQLTALYEDRWALGREDPLDAHLPLFLATRALKPA